MDEESAPAATDERLKTLEERVTNLQALQEIARKCAVNEANITALSTRLDLVKRIEELENDIHKWQWLAKYISITAAIVIGVASVVGYHSIRDLVQTVVNNQVAPLNLRILHDATTLDGLARMQSHPDAAIGYFLAAFEQDRYDESVLVQLLNALDTTRRWDDAKQVIETLKQNKYKYTHMQDPQTYNNIGNLELYLGVDNPSYWESAKEDLELGELITDPTDKEVLPYLNVNLCRYYATQSNSDAALKYAAYIAKDFPDFIPLLKNNVTSSWSEDVKKHVSSSAAVFASLRSQIEAAERKTRGRGEAH
jgi:hypothetical protein